MLGIGTHGETSRACWVSRRDHWSLLELTERPVVAAGTHGETSRVGGSRRHEPNPGVVRGLSWKPVPFFYRFISVSPSFPSSVSSPLHPAPLSHSHFILLLVSPPPAQFKYRGHFLPISPRARRAPCFVAHYKVLSVTPRSRDPPH